jgi:mono/diheme cytochrome c family protein
MTRFLVFVLLTAMTALGTQISSPPVPSDQAPLATFNKDVLPILQKNCQGCHRPGGVAPMSFVTYESTRPWAKAIKTAVLSKQMPPWFADPHYGEFRNAPKLSQSDINTLAVWVDSGAREGNAADKPPSPKWADGWRIQPDVIVSMAEPYHVDANGAGEIKEFFVPNPLKEDTWVTSIEIRPSNPSVVHHVIVQVPDVIPAAGLARAVFACGDCPQTIDSSAKLQKVEALQAMAAVADAKKAGNINSHSVGSYSSVQAKLLERMTGRGVFTTMEAVYAPGSPPLDFRFTDSAKLIRAGKPIRIEVHYTPNGKETTDQTMVGFTLAKAPPQRRFIIMAPEHLVDARKPIPAGEANWETSGELTFNRDADLVWFMPHMHLRGKDMTFRLIYPDGREETVLSVKYNFNWQLGYEVETPIQVTKGTRMVVTAHHDNSANNPMNPAPDKDVVWGELTSQEMMLPWFGVVVRGDAQPDAIASYKPGDFDGPVGVPFAGRGQKVPLVQPAILRQVK